jgi:CheY-like chemotaxis protein
MRPTQSTILLVDEDIQFLELASQRLQKLGYRVKPARSTVEARQLVSELRPCMILIDRGLPGDGTAGRRILAALKGDPDVAHIPVLMTSARQNLLS